MIVQNAKLAFELDGQMIPITQLMPTKKLPPDISTSVKYKQTEISMLKNGIIESIVVFPKDDGSGEYLLLDGHMRIQILENLGIMETFCLISKDDESYTYNKFINRVTNIQEHFMILKGINSGVSEDKLAEQLGVDIRKIKEKVNLLKGICPEAVELLKTQEISRQVFGVLRKMNASRQIEVAQTMIDANKFSLQFVKAMLVLSSAEKLVNPKTVKKEVNGLSAEQLTRTEQEIANMETEYKLAESSLANDVLTMVVFRGYLAKLTNNRAIADYLSREEKELFQEFQRIVESGNLDDLEGEKK